MTLDPSVHSAMVATIPKLRAFAISLCRSPEHADDLVQETLLRACANIASFQPGTNMAGWLFTILRNCFYTERRKRRREVEDINGIYADTLVIQPGQIARACPTTKPPGSAVVRSARSRAGSTAPACASPRRCRLTAWPTWRTIRSRNPLFIKQSAGARTSTSKGQCPERRLGSGTV
jgi:RNA polymerase sigma factor (sigma-70 family)